jgi:ABC-type transport system involved in cytochrome c biogenesis permease subunit
MLPIILFGIAAVGGLTMAILRLRKPENPLPIGLALAHGALAAAGLVALILAVVGAGTAAPDLLKASLVIFVVAALGGFFLFSFQLRKKPIPVGVMVIHALAAVTAFALLLVTAVR